MAPCHRCLRLVRLCPNGRLREHGNNAGLCSGSFGKPTFAAFRAVPTPQDPPRQ